MNQKNINIVGWIACLYGFAIGYAFGYFFIEQYLWRWLSLILAIAPGFFSCTLVGLFCIKDIKDKTNHDMKQGGVIIASIMLMCATGLTIHQYSEVQKNKELIALEKRALLEEHQKNKKSACTESQKQAAMNTQSMLQTLGRRDDNGSSVHYIWNTGWYSLSYDKQLNIMQSIADTEFCLSEGRKKIFRIEYNGDIVAEATPIGGIKVVKSRP